MLTITIHTTEANFKQEVESVAAASAAWRKHRDHYFIGSRDMRGNCGILEKDGKKIGHVSYNGRAWDLEEKPWMF